MKLFVLCCIINTVLMLGFVTAVPGVTFTPYDYGLPPGYEFWASLVGSAMIHTALRTVLSFVVLLPVLVLLAGTINMGMELDALAAIFATLLVSFFIDVALYNFLTLFSFYPVFGLGNSILISMVDTFLSFLFGLLLGMKVEVNNA